MKTIGSGNKMTPLGRSRPIAMKALSISSGVFTSSRRGFTRKTRAGDSIARNAGGGGAVRGLHSVALWGTEGSHSLSQPLVFVLISHVLRVVLRASPPGRAE